MIGNKVKELGCPVVGIEMIPIAGWQTLLLHLNPDTSNSFQITFPGDLTVNTKKGFIFKFGKYSNDEYPAG